MGHRVQQSIKAVSVADGRMLLGEPGQPPALWEFLKIQVFSADHLPRYPGAISSEQACI